jgi:hypothetical protein
MSIRQAVRKFGLARKTIRKMLAYSVAPGYEKKLLQRPKVGPWLGVINQIREDDISQPKKQRHSARRIWDRLKAEHSTKDVCPCSASAQGHPGGLSVVRTDSGRWLCATELHGTGAAGGEWG